MHFGVVQYFSHIAFNGAVPSKFFSAICSVKSDTYISFFGENLRSRVEAYDQGKARNLLQ